MTDLQLIKIAVQRLKAMGVGSQKEIGALMGYRSESAFSQVLNGRVPIPGDFIERLGKLSEDVKKFINDSKETKPIPNNISIHNEPNQQDMNDPTKKIYENYIERLEREVEELKQQVNELKGVKAKLSAS